MQLPPRPRWRAPQNLSCSTPHFHLVVSYILAPFRVLFPCRSSRHFSSVPLGNFAPFHLTPSTLFRSVTFSFDFLHSVAFTLLVSAITFTLLVSVTAFTLLVSVIAFTLSVRFSRSLSPFHLSHSVSPFVSRVHPLRSFLTVTLPVSSLAFTLSISSLEFALSVRFSRSFVSRVRSLEQRQYLHRNLQQYQ